jgi:hypothetical protein
MSKQGKLNDKLPNFDEICAGAEASSDPVTYLKLAINKDKRVANILGYCAKPPAKLPLPAGTPPYQPSSYTESSLAEITILHQHDKLAALFNPNMRQFKREELWVNWIERMSPKEAEIMNAIKDQTLHAMFPKLTKLVIAESLGWPLDQYRALCEKFKVEP